MTATRNERDRTSGDQAVLTDELGNALVLVALVTVGWVPYLAHRSWVWVRTGRWVYP